MIARSNGLCAAGACPAVSTGEALGDHPFAKLRNFVGRLPVRQVSLECPTAQGSRDLVGQGRVELGQILDASSPSDATSKANVAVVQQSWSGPGPPASA